MAALAASVQEQPPEQAPPHAKTRQTRTSTRAPRSSGSRMRMLLLNPYATHRNTASRRVVANSRLTGRHALHQQPQGSDLHHPPDAVCPPPTSSVSANQQIRRSRKECAEEPYVGPGFRLSRRRQSKVGLSYLVRGKVLTAVDTFMRTIASLSTQEPTTTPRVSTPTSTWTGTTFCKSLFPSSRRPLLVPYV